MLLHYILNAYASNWPGSRGFDDVKKIETADKQSEKENSSSQNEIRKLSTVAKLSSNSSFSLAFGEVIMRTLPKGKAVDYNTANAMSQIAYAGMYEHLLN